MVESLKKDAYIYSVEFNKWIYKVVPNSNNSCTTLFWSELAHASFQKLREEEK